jgi:large subunit ribosomal protein L4
MAVKYETLTEVPEVVVDKINYGHIAAAYRRQRRHAHPRTAKTKTKAEVDLSKQKWIRQKGTGRARQGPKSSPHLTGGGVVFGPLPGLKEIKLNKKVRRDALLSALKHHMDHEAVKVLKSAEFEGFVRTKQAYDALLHSGFTGKGIVVIPRGVPVARALRNVAGIVVLTPERLNVGDLVESNFVIFTENALEQARSHFRGELAVGELDETVGIEPADADEGGATDE